MDWSSDAVEKLVVSDDELVKRESRGSSGWFVVVRKAEFTVFKMLLLSFEDARKERVLVWVQEGQGHVEVVLEEEDLESVWLERKLGSFMILGFLLIFSL